MNIKDSYIHNGEAILKDIQVSGSKLQKLKAGKDANDAYLTWVDVLDLSPFGASGHNHDDRYLKLIGNDTTNPLTGTVYFKDVNGIVLNSNNKDLNIWEVYGNSGAWASQYGFNLQYAGTGSGNDNDLVLWAHNQNGTHVETYRVKQDGTFIFKAAPKVGTNIIYHAGNDGSGSGLDADKLDGYHATCGDNKPWGTIPVITTGGYMDVGKHFEFHYDNTTGSDYSTILMCTGNYSNIVNLPSASGTLALTSQIPTKDSWNYDDRYLKLSGGTLTGTLGKSDNYIFKPNGGDFRTTGDVYTGAICISLPSNIGNTMVSMWIDVYNYVTNTSFSVHVGGYTYTNSTFQHSPFAMVYGASYKVRLAYNNGFKIYIGETNSTWHYPQISIRDVVLGYGPSYSNWYNDWSVSFVTSFPAIEVEITRYAITTDNISNQSVKSATTSTYASNIGTSGIAGTNYVTAANVISMYNWYNTITSTDPASNTAIDKWNEIISFLSGITDTSTLSGILAGYAAAGHNHDGRYLRWNGSAADVSAMAWGTLTAANGYKILSHAASSDGGDWGMANQSGKIYMQLDGYYYQNEGQYRVSDVSETVTALGTNENYLTWTKNGTTNNITVPYANNTDTIDGYHISDNYNLPYKNITTLTCAPSSITEDYWYIKILIQSSYQDIVNQKMYLVASYSNYMTKAELQVYGYYLGYKYTASTYNADTITGIASTRQIASQVIWLRMKKPTRYEGVTPNGSIAIYSNYITSAEVITSAPFGVTFTDTLQSDGQHILSGNIKAAGFKKNGSDDNYILLGGGGHKAVSDFATAGHTHYIGTTAVRTYPDYQTLTGINKFLFQDDGSLAIYTTDGGQDCGPEHVNIQTCFDNKDPQTHEYVNNYTDRCNLIFQPRGGQVVIGKNMDGVSNTTEYKLRIGGSTQIEAFSPLLNFCDTDANSYATTTARINFNNSYATVGYIEQAGETLRISSIGGSSSVILRTNGSDRLLINNNGNVGIGTNEPSYKLHVAGDIYTTTGFKKNGSSDDYVLLGGGGHKLESNLSVKYAISAGSATNANYFIGCTNTITVAGDSNTYYPVMVSTTANKKFRNIITVWKDLGSKTASYSGNHDNGTSSMLYRYDVRNCYWDGNGGYCTTLDARYMYAPLVSETMMLNSGVGNFCIWLRGGGTEYNISTSWNISLSDITVYYSSTNVGSNTYPVTIAPRRDIGNGGVYNNISIPCDVKYAYYAGSVAWNNVTGKPATATRWPSWSEVTDKPTFTTWSETSYTSTYSLSNAAWTNTITLPTTAGSYILNITSGNSTLTGVFSIGASDNAKDEISLHLHGNGPRLYARTNGTTLQLSSSDTNATSRSVTIKYRRMI